MPVTVKPSPQKVGKNIDKTIHSGTELLTVSPSATLDERRLLRYQKRIPPEIRRIIQSSFSDLDKPDPPCVIPYSSGFVISIIRAFQQDLHLVLRPDDIWLSILTQFSMFVNGN
jgi:hypothetical protein